MEKNNPHATLSLLPGQFKTSFPNSYYYNSHLGKTPPPLHTLPLPERSKQGAHYEEIPDQHHGFKEDEYDYIPDVCHTNVRRNKSCEPEPPVPPKRKDFLESDVALRRKSCPQEVIATTTQHVYYNLGKPLTMGAQQSKNILDPRPYNTKNDPPTLEREMSPQDDEDYYNLKDPSHGILPKPSLPQKSYSVPAYHEDTDDCDYVNSWLPISEEAKQGADLNLRQPSLDPVKNESLSYPSHQESAKDLPHSYRNINILTPPPPESDSPTSSPRLPPRGVTHSSSTVPEPLFHFKKSPKLPESETANTPASFSRLPPRGVINSFSTVPAPLTKSSKPQKPPPPPKPLKLTLSRSKPTNKRVIRDHRHSSSSSQSEPATPSDLAEENKKLQEENARLEEEKEQLWHRCSDLDEQLSDLQKQLETKTSEVVLLQQRLSEIRSQPCTGSQTVEFWKVSRKDIQVQEHKILGRGGWGYVAEGRFRSQKVAVKRVYKEILQPYTMERIHREVDTMAQVRHPNLLLFIAAVLDDEGGPMIITEILDMSLRKAYENRHLGSRNTTRTRIFRDIASALNYLHQQREPIIHRDVSSANVLLEAIANNVWKAKLSDFGSANLLRLATTPGVGALVYTAPEGFPQPHTSHPPPQTPKIDVYSFGVLLCEVITQKFPDPDNFSNMLRQVRRKWLSMHALIIHCTKTKPEDRPPMTDILEQLDKMPEFSYNY